LRTSLLATVVLVFNTSVIVCGQQTEAKVRSDSVEIFQVLDLPLNVHEAVLTEKGFGSVLRLRLSNESTSELLGIRYSLIPIDPERGTLRGINPIEGFQLTAHDSKTITFKTPIKLSTKRGIRFVLMLEQVISSESIWEVVKAKEALDAYIKGDYSIRPTVIRVANAVDAPPQTRVIY
jgi:hypothetical protein